MAPCRLAIVDRPFANEAERVKIQRRNVSGEYTFFHALKSWSSVGRWSRKRPCRASLLSSENLEAGFHTVWRVCATRQSGRQIVGFLLSKLSFSIEFKASGI